MTDTTTANGSVIMFITGLSCRPAITVCTRLAAKANPKYSYQEINEDIVRLFLVYDLQFRHEEEDCLLSLICDTQAYTCIAGGL